MKKKDQQKQIVGYIISAVFWYLFLWSLIFYLTVPGQDIYMGALVLFITGLVGIVACPWSWDWLKM